MLVCAFLAAASRSPERWSLDEERQALQPGWSMKKETRARELREQQTVDRLAAGEDGPDRLSDLPGGVVPQVALLERRHGTYEAELPPEPSYSDHMHSESLMERPTAAVVNPDGTLSMLLQTASQALGLQAAKDAELPDGEGAPQDGYRTCAQAGKDCKCDTGEVRFGSTTNHEFSHPIMLGANKEVLCTAEALSETAANMPDGDGAEENQACFCNLRSVHVQVDVAATSFAEQETEAADEATTETGMLCLAPGSSSAAFQQRSALERADHNRAETAVLDFSRSFTENDATSSAVPVVLADCTTLDDQAKTWVYLLSSGQIKHLDTGTCLTADFTRNAADRIVAKPCTLMDSQKTTQRWEVPFYIAPDFKQGHGIIRLAYGAHGQHGQCLSNDGEHLLLDRCSEISGSTEWKMTSVAGSTHSWEICSEPGNSCECGGDVKFGSDDRKLYSQPIAMQDAGKGSVCCSAHGSSSCGDGVGLVDAAAWIPAPEVKEQECQCRHDKFMDGEGDAASNKQLELAESSPSSSIPGGTQGFMGIGLVVVLGGGFLMYRRKQAMAYEEFEEEEEYEEEYEEEEE